MTNRALSGIMLLAGFVMIVSVSSLYVQSEIEHGNVCSCSFPIYLLIPILSSTGLLVGSTIYYTFMENHNRDFSPLLKLLDRDERLVIKALVKEGGSSTQARLVSASGLNKVKVSRLITHLETKGAIIKSPRGMTNQIELSNDLKDLFN